jgi:hypothetical protein
MGDRTFTAADHVPLMIYPNPLSPSRYVVLNSGLTVQDREYPASDYLTPLYGDFALLKTGTDGPLQVETAGLFDETWRLPATLSAPATASVAQK